MARALHIIQLSAINAGRSPETLADTEAVIVAQAEADGFVIYSATQRGENGVVYLDLDVETPAV